MKVILIDSNKNLVWTEVSESAPRNNEIVIDIKAAALNRADLMQRAGNYPPPHLQDGRSGWAWKCPELLVKCRRYAVGKSATRSAPCLVEEAMPKRLHTYEHDYLVQEVVLAASGYTKWRK